MSTRRKKTLQWLSLIGAASLNVIIAQAAYAGGFGAGNGGGILYCPNRPEGQQALLIDLWEADRTMARYSGMDAMSVEQLLARARTIIEGVGLRGRFGHPFLRAFDDELAHVKREFARARNAIDPNQEELDYPFEEFPVGRPIDCEYKAVAVYQADGRIRTNPRYLDLLRRSSLQYAGILLHETLYRLGRDFADLTTSLEIRPIVAAILSPDDSFGIPGEPAGRFWRVLEQFQGIFVHDLGMGGEPLHRRGNGYYPRTSLPMGPEQARVRLHHLDERTQATSLKLLITIPGISVRQYRRSTRRAARCELSYALLNAHGRQESTRQNITLTLNEDQDDHGRFETLIDPLDVYVQSQADTERFLFGLDSIRLVDFLNPDEVQITYAIPIYHYISELKQGRYSLAIDLNCDSSISTLGYSVGFNATQRQGSLRPEGIRMNYGGAVIQLR